MRYEIGLNMKCEIKNQKLNYKVFLACSAASAA